MLTNARRDAYKHILNLAAEQGYVTVDNIMDAADKWQLPINDLDWLSNSLMTNGIIIYDEPPIKEHTVTADEDYDDYAQIDYDEIFRRIEEKEPSLKPLVNDVKQIKPPQYKEFAKLIYQAKEGNLHARNRIVEMNLRLALKTALQRSEQFDANLIDCVEDACIGLLLAIEKYNPDINGAFASYASLWILQTISREQPTQRPDVYYPVHKKEQYYTMYPVLKNKGCVTCKDIWSCDKVKNIIAERLKCTNEQTTDVILQTQPFESFEVLYSNLFLDDKYFFEQHNKSLKTYLTKSMANYEEMQTLLDAKERNKAVAKVLNTLTPREEFVIKKRYGFDNDREETLEEIGRFLGVTRERIRQIEKKAMTKLQHSSRSKLLKEYFT